MLAARSGGVAAASEAGGAAAPDQGDERGQALSDLAKKVEDFVGGKGDMDGARFAELVIRPVDKLATVCTD